MPDSLPSFSRTDQHGWTFSFPDHPALLCFVKEDCPTCDMTMPLIEAAWRAFQGEVDVLAIGQEAAGNALLIERHKLTGPMLDDSDLKLSHAYNVEIVPTIILAETGGAELCRFEGFDKSDWQRVLSQAAHLAGRTRAANRLERLSEIASRMRLEVGRAGRGRAARRRGVGLAPARAPD